MGEAFGSAARIVGAAIQTPHPQAIIKQLTNTVARLLDEGQPEKVLHTALVEWDETPDAGPPTLPYIVSRVLRRNKPRPKKKNDWEEKLREEMGG